MRYEFGRNWAEFIEKNFNDERIDAAKQHLLGFMKLDSLRGKRNGECLRIICIS